MKFAPQTPMNIVCSMPSAGEAAQWVEDLRSALGQGVAVSSWRADVVGRKPAANAEVAVVWKPLQGFVDAHPNLCWVFCIGAGVDALLRLNWPAHTRIVRLEDAGMGDQMAEYVGYGVLRFYREFDAYEAGARRQNWLPREPQSKADWPVGILGYGVLAQPVAKWLTRMGFAVHAWARNPKPDAAVQVFAGSDALPEFLRQTRVLVCMLPLTPETRQIIRADALAQLPQGAYLINVARGGHVNQADLLAALDAGQLSGALLDVCEPEPLPRDHALWHHPKVTLTPHIAAATLRADAVAQIVGKLLQLQAGVEITGVVGQVGY